MCRTVHKKISINFKSVKKVQEEHDQISQKYYQRSTPKVTVKKDTKFKELRKILPDTFEWIKTRKRLIQETTMQNHCVWSYASFINKDQCQIYSYVDERGERYTLEFRTKRNKYVLQQARGKYNTINTQINQYVDEILADYYMNMKVKK